MAETNKEQKLNDECLNDADVESVTDKNESENKPTKSSVFKKKENHEAQKIKDLETDILNLNEKLAVAKNEYFKAYADSENTKKRLQQDFETRKKYMIQDFAIDILPAIDNLERALANADKESSIYVGVEMVLQQIQNALKKEGVEEIAALGLPFDPNFHHAIITEAKDGVEPNMVIEVLQKGYKLKDRILRATLVKVSE